MIEVPEDVLRDIKNVLENADIFNEEVLKWDDESEIIGPEVKRLIHRIEDLLEVPAGRRWDYEVK